MKSFLIRFTIFITILLGLSWLLDIIITQSLQKSKQLEFASWNDLRQGRIDADIIIHGSSRAWVQINPAIIENKFHRRTYNLGLDAFGFHMQYCRHLLLLKHNKQPKIIIHVLDYSLFDKGNFLFNPDQFLPFIGDSIIDTFTEQYKGIDYFDRTLPFWRYVGHQRTIRHAGKILLRPDKNIADRINGYEPQYRLWNKDLESARTLMKAGKTEPIDSAVVSLFKKYIRDCRQRNIRLILIYPPEYIEGQNFIRNRKEILDLFREIAEENDVPYFDYSTHPISWQQKYFYNTEHLNAEGSDVFTKVLCEDLLYDW